MRLGLQPPGRITPDAPPLKWGEQSQEQEILGQSMHEGRFTPGELLHHSTARFLTRTRVSGGEPHTFFLNFSGDEPDSAILVNEKRDLYGDPAVLYLDDTEELGLYLMAPPVADALTSRTRIFGKNHLKRNGRLDIPIISAAPTRWWGGVPCLTIYDSQAPLAAAHVAIRKGKLVIMSDVTDSNGRYICVVPDRTGERTRSIIEFYKCRAETRVGTGGTEYEKR
ncbi:MAG: hypothetical protein WBH88_04140 [Candidatus Methanoculleus thermohydrogenotrophicum]|jgi:hypothetical protein|nr:hypothetical protein [Candidatus Methanoculleus thermohydrogenotrophicum]